MTLLENNTYSWTSWLYASFTQSITSSGTNPLRTRNTSSCQSSSSESFTEMNHPDVRILTIRRYTWTSWPRPVSGGPKLLVPSPQGVYSISVHTKLYGNVSMTYTSFNRSEADGGSSDLGYHPGIFPCLHVMCDNEVQWNSAIKTT